MILRVETLDLFHGDARALDGVSLEVSEGTIVAIVAFFVLGMTVGHALGGPKPAERAVLALASAARHPGIALAILTANLPDHKSALAAILLSVVVSMIVPIPYLRWIKPRIVI